MTKKEILKELDRLARAMETHETFIKEYGDILNPDFTDANFLACAYGILHSEIANLATEGDIFKACEKYNL